VLAELDDKGAVGRLAAARLCWRRVGPAAARGLVAGEGDAEVELAARLEHAEGEPAAAARLLGRIRQPPARLARAVAGTLRWHGHLGAASEVLSRGASLPEAPLELEADRERLEGELAVLRGGWAPAPRKTRAHAPRTGRVLHLLRRSRPHVESGYAIRSHYVLRAQRDAGLDPVAVTQLGFPEDGDGALVELLDGIAYHRLAPAEAVPPRLDRAMTRGLEELDALCAELRPAVLQPATNHVNAQLALALRDRLGVPVVYEVRGFWEESWLARRPDPEAAIAADEYRLRRAAELACMLQADRLVTLGEVMKHEIVARGVPAERVVVVPNAVDPEAFAPVAPDPALARRLGVEGAEAVLGYVSRLALFEGVEHLLGAVAELRARGHRVVALVVGDGSERRRLERHAAQLGLGDAAVFTGRVPHEEVLAYYALIDIFVIPRVDARVSRLVTPLKPFEALAAGRALVVSDLPALREIVEPGRTGLTFRAGDALNLAEVVEPLVDDPARRRELGEAGRDWVAAERTWRGNGERYRALMQELGVA
jgi:glycosyltransferase involved in cell wall biosynthesis